MQQRHNRALWFYLTFWLDPATVCWQNTHATFVGRENHFQEFNFSLPTATHLQIAWMCNRKSPGGTLGPSIIKGYKVPDNFYLGLLLDEEAISNFHLETLGVWRLPC